MKNFLFACILILVSYLIIELFAYSAYAIKFGDYNLEKIQQSKLTAANSKKTSGVYSADNFDGKDVRAKSILHPYIGYTVDGKRRKPDCESKVAKDCYSRIKTMADAPPHKRAPEKLIIAILGGSFADGVARIGKAKIKTALNKSAQYKNHEIIIYGLAGGGYKQPQQLTQTAYYYALGVEFDVVINLDGFNEMATPLSNYRDRGVHPAFPAFWNARVASSMNQDFLNLYSNKVAVQNSHVRFANLSLTKGLSYSPLVNFSWRFLNQNFQQKLASIEAEIASSNKPKARDFAYEALGPDYNFTNWDAFGDYLGNLWVDSSLAMRAMVEGQGGLYLHFLQPNQYIDGNKILSSWERANAVLESGSYGNVYQLYHPVLLEKSKVLEQRGVNYFDLTFIFKDISDTLYIDNCCHINNKGIDLIAEKLVETILSQKNNQFQEAKN